MAVFTPKSFTPTHEFRGLELELRHRNGYFNSEYIAEFRTEDGDLVALPEHLATRLPERPQPGEVWKFKLSTTAPNLRGVNDLCQLYNLSNMNIVWNPEEDSVDLLSDYTKVLNSDGTPYREDS